MIRILLADDLTIIRKGMLQILTQAYPQAEIEEIKEGEEWMERLKDNPWDVIISDHGGWDTLQRVCADYPGLPILILSLYANERAGDRLPDYDPAIHLGRDAAADELIWAVRQVVEGKKYFTIPSKNN